MSVPASLVKPQPAPQSSAHPAVWDLVLVDIAERERDGVAKYGTRLQPHNGRDALVDAYQEALDLVVYLRQTLLDLVVYLRQTLYERDGK